MSQSHMQHPPSPTRRRGRKTASPESATTAAGIAAERATLAARDRDLSRARAAARRLGSGVLTPGRSVV